MSSLKVFIIIGGQKGATTALHCFLAEHPGLCMSEPKETNFFVLNENSSDQEYLKFFPHYAGESLLGEASPVYMLRHATVAKRISAYREDMKLIAIFRNPIERAYSHYQMLFQKGMIDIDFTQALAIARSISGYDEIEFDKTTGYPARPVETLLEYGYYCKQIKSFFRYFGKEQFLFLRNEDLAMNHARTLSRVFNFLEADQVEISPRLVHHREYVNLSSNDWEQLSQIYAQEIVEMEALLGWDLATWKIPPSELKAADP
jgi:hypothetical protein